MKQQLDAPEHGFAPGSMEMIKARLQECLGDLDRLELHHPAALVAMAIDQLDQMPADRAPFG